MNLLDRTTHFMRLADQLDRPPSHTDHEVVAFRRRLLAEEYGEYLDAEDSGDLVAVVDSLLDIIVVAWGSLLVYVGEPKTQAAAEEVARSNLAKVAEQPTLRRSDGKILKPPGWLPPNIAGVLED